MPNTVALGYLAILHSRRFILRIEWQRGLSAALESQAATFNATAGTSAARETTIVSRAFIQFAGLTAGRIDVRFLRGCHQFQESARVPTRSSLYWPIRRPSENVSRERSPLRTSRTSAPRSAARIASTTAAPINIGGVSATLSKPAGGLPGTGNCR